MIKLIATDMDGTFLDKTGSYDKQRLAVLLQKCREKGIYFVVASDRSLLSIKKLFQEFQNEILFLAENGGVVEYQGKLLHEEIMPRELYLKIVDRIKTSPFHATDTVHLSGKEATYVFSDIRPSYQTFLEHYSPCLVPVTDFANITDSIYKVGASFSEEEVHRASQWINETMPEVASMTSGYDCLDVMMKHVNKGVALEKLCQHLGITRKEVIAFGDNLNDSQMLRMAGQAIVPNNAQAEIKKIADKVLASHETGSVIRYMEEVVCQLN